MIYLTKSNAFGIVLSPNRTEKKFFSKWLVENQPENMVAIRKEMANKYGLFLRESRITYKNGTNQFMNVSVLLIGSDEVYVPVEFLTETKTYVE